MLFKLTCGPSTENLKQEDEEPNDHGTTIIHKRRSDNKWFWEKSNDDESYDQHRLMNKSQQNRYSNQLVVHLARKLFMAVNGPATMATTKGKRRRESRRFGFIQDWLWLLGHLIKKLEVDNCY